MASFRNAMDFLQVITADVLEASRVPPGASVAGYGPNTTGGTLIRPGGRDCYPSFWIRDFTMSLECGLISPEELEHALLLTARCQASEDWNTPSGSLVPRGAIADHITFDGKPIYFPGTYDYETQGQPWGYYPSLDDHFFFIEMAWRLVSIRGRETVLDEIINGKSLLERLDQAFSVPTVADDESELVWCEEKDRGVGFGFTDIVVHTGHLLFCSILRWQAAVRLAELHGLSGKASSVARYRNISDTISSNLATVFGRGTALLKASTGRSAQPDVWASAFAVYSGALSGDAAIKVSMELTRCFSAGTIAWNGNIRHVPTDGDFSEQTAWEKTVGGFGINTYQNGAYWNTPTGWVCYAIAQVDPEAARELACGYVDELLAGDFRQGERYGSPFECIHPDGYFRQNPVYLTSVTCPLAAFIRLGWIEIEQ
ncbi:MAG: hypothetical protein HN368_20455 [Spirochaetales bacterium]|nr:hypothetical protein [Spirochaetales bacterium]